MTDEGTTIMLKLIGEALDDRLDQLRRVHLGLLRPTTIQRGMAMVATASALELGRQVPSICKPPRVLADEACGGVVAIGGAHAEAAHGEVTT